MAKLSFENGHFGPGTVPLTTESTHTAIPPNQLSPKKTSLRDTKNLMDPLSNSTTLSLPTCWDWVSLSSLASIHSLLPLVWAVTAVPLSRRFYFVWRGHLLRLPPNDNDLATPFFLDFQSTPTKPPSWRRQQRGALSTTSSTVYHLRYSIPPCFLPQPWFTCRATSSPSTMHPQGTHNVLTMRWAPSNLGKRIIDVNWIGLMRERSIDIKQ